MLRIDQPLTPQFPTTYHSPRLVTVGKTINLIRGGGGEEYDETGLAYGWKKF